MVLSAPSFDEAHPYRTMFGELVHSFVAVIDALRKQLSEFLIVEYLERTLGRDLTHGGRMESVMEVTVPTLNEHGGVTEALCEHLAANVVEVHAFADVSSRVLDGGVAVHVGHATETKAVRGGVGVGEAVDDEAGSRGLEGFSYADVQFVVGDGAPVLRFMVGDRCHVWWYGGL